MAIETYDAFISYATEDQERFVDPLVKALTAEGFKIWYDKDFVLPGDLLRNKIDDALLKSKAGIVIASPRYFSKHWTISELNAITATMTLIIPVLYKLSLEELKSYSPILFGRKITIISESIPDIVINIKKTLQGLKKKKVRKSLKGVLVIGSVHSENVLDLEGELEFGQKHIISRKELFGGSGLNVSLRLLNMKCPAFPVLSMGRSRVGNLIREKLVEATRLNINAQQLIDFIQSDKIFCEGLNTTQATMAVSKRKQQRISFIEKPANPLKFRDFFRARVNELTDMVHESQLKIAAVVIGHIYADNPKYNKDNPGEITKEIIDKFNKAGIPVLANFGSSQLCKGIDFWQDYLDKLCVFQVSLGEMRRFFSMRSNETSLVNILEYFIHHRITSVITLNKLGALGTFRDGTRDIIYAKPLEIKDFKDPIGAGDAHLAGLVSSLYKKNNIEFDDFRKSLVVGRLWAAYACQTNGGANDCPTIDMLKDYEQRIRVHHSSKDRGIPTVEVRALKHFDDILGLIDKIP